MGRRVGVAGSGRRAALGRRPASRTSNQCPHRDDRTKARTAWEGKSHHDENGAAYHALNNAMRAALLTAVRPEAWTPTPVLSTGLPACDPKTDPRRMSAT